jgi:WD40 repeat protein
MQSVPSSPRKTAQLERVLLSRHDSPSKSSLPDCSPRKKSVRMSTVPKMEYRKKILLTSVPFEDDFYLNLLDWSPSGILATGQGNRVMCHRIEGLEIVKSVPAFEAHGNVCAVTFNANDQMATSDLQGRIHFVPLIGHSMYTTLRGHCNRVGVLNFHPNGQILSSGGRDNRIAHYDLRTSKTPFHVNMSAHHQEICGCKWSPSGRMVAIGGNDNVLSVWDAAKLDGKPLMRIEGAHSAAIKALCWTEQEILVSGGGTSDRRISMWDTNTAQKVGSILTPSQVCCLISSPNVAPDTLVSTHGFTEHYVAIWDMKMFSLQNNDVQEPLHYFQGHNARVLYAARSPCQRVVCTGAGDGSVRLWECFQETPKTLMRRHLESIYL